MGDLSIDLNSLLVLSYVFSFIVFTHVVILYFSDPYIPTLVSGIFFRNWSLTLPTLGFLHYRMERRKQHMTKQNDSSKFQRMEEMMLPKIKTPRGFTTEHSIHALEGEVA